ncbi:hypothetical protein, partial [Rhodoblastus sp.]|uniref:hypothetical protein n=1 Tax=Rhodoblastus sp. TaxID=1962975 RepID=UPI0035AF112B
AGAAGAAIGAGSGADSIAAGAAGLAAGAGAAGVAGWLAIGSGESGFCAWTASGAAQSAVAETRARIFVARLMIKIPSATAVPLRTMRPGLPSFLQVRPQILPFCGLFAALCLINGFSGFFGET